MQKYTHQFKLSAIQAFLARGFGFRFIAEQFGMDPSLLRRWVEAYRLHGEASLKPRGKDHTPQFKLSVLQHMWREKLSLRRTAAVFNLVCSTQIGSWEQQYYSGGLPALVTRKIGKPPAMPKKPAKSKVATPLTEEQRAYKNLLAEVEFLRMENAYLKKLKELREEKARLRELEQKKPG